MSNPSSDASITELLNAIGTLDMTPLAPHAPVITITPPKDAPAVIRDKSPSAVASEPKQARGGSG